MNRLVAAKTSCLLNPKTIPRRIAAAAAALLGLVSGAFAANEAAVTLAWNANPEPNVAGYRLQYGTVSGVYPNSIDAGNETSATATGLNEGTVYYFVVVAYNNAGQTSAPSSQISYTVPGTPNTAPTAGSFAVTVAEDGQAAVTLNGTDAESNPLSYTVVTPPAKGALSGTAPNLTYRPNANVNGSDSFTYRTSDGVLNSALATVSITITPVNDGPVATPRSVTTNEDTPVAVVLSGTDVDGDSLTYTVLTQPTKGTLTGTPPNLTYNPTANANGSDSFTFRVNDGTVNSAAATVSITITPVNDPPVATPRLVTTSEDTPVAITLSGTDVEGSPLSYTVLSQPSKGSLSGTPPNVIYTPNLNANGADSFTFRVRDGSLDSAPATVSISITPVNDIPVANPRSVSTVKNTPVAIVLTGSDVEGSPLTFTVLTSPAKGELSGTAPNLTYTPNSDVTGADSFTFRINDGTANSATSTVSISVTEVNSVPVATPRSVTTLEDTNVAITLAGTDADGDTLTYTVLTQPTKGTLTGTAPNLTYRPNANANGSDSFTFRVNDGTANSTPATVSISITPVNDIPVANPRSVSTSRNTPVAVVLTGSDVEGSPLTYTVLTSPTKGVLSGTAPNLTYTPNLNVTGADSFTFRVNDGAANSPTATVSINITNANAAPQALSRSLATMKNEAVKIPLAGSDADGNDLTFRVVSQPANGALSGTPPLLTFKPEKNFVGNASFTYVANDGTADSAPATVVVKVKPSNKKPVALAMAVVANQNANFPMVLGATDEDGDVLTFQIVKQPLNGTLTGTPPNLVYRPNTGFRGDDRFTFRVNDGVVNSAVAGVAIKVINPNNRQPASGPWAVSTLMKTAAPVTLRATDADGDVLTYRLVSKPSSGRLTGKMPNLVYKPKAKFVGTDRFTYVANDGTVDSAPITVTITVTEPPAVADRAVGKGKADPGADPVPTISLRVDPNRAGRVVLEISGTPGESYLLEHSVDLNLWSVEQEIEIGAGGNLSLEVTTAPGATRGFYRLNAP